MSSFNCEHCHKQITDTDIGYVTGCEHWPVDPKVTDHYLRVQLLTLRSTVKFLQTVAEDSKSHMAAPLKRWSEELNTSIQLLQRSPQA